MLRGELAESRPGLVAPLSVRTGRRGDYVWAWTLAGVTSAPMDPLPTTALVGEGEAIGSDPPGSNYLPPVMEASS